MRPLLAALREALERSGQIAKAQARGYNTDNILFHATDAPQDFTGFRRRLGDIGIHLGTLGQAEDRLRFMRGRRDKVGGERVYPVFARTRRPVRLRFDPGSFDKENLPYALPEELFKELRESGTQLHRRIGRNPWHANSALATIRDFLEGKGFDSVVYKNTGEVAETPEMAALREIIERNAKSGYREVNKNELDRMRAELARLRAAAQEDSVAVFRPHQIKSVFARDFDARSNDMLRAVLAALLGGGAGGLAAEARTES